MVRTIDGATALSPEEALRRIVRRGLGGAMAISMVMQIMLMLGALYVAVLNDSVLPGRSVPTLVGLFALILTLYIAVGLFDTLRGRLLFDIAGSVELGLAARIYDGLGRIAAEGAGEGDGLQPLHDGDRVRAFLVGPIPAALMDICAAPLALLLLFALHPWLGAAALAGMVAIALLAWLAGRSAGANADALAQAQPLRLGLAGELRRHILDIRGLGMAGRMRQRWLGVNREFLALHRMRHRRSTGLEGVLRGARFVMFAVILTVGAALAFDDRGNWSSSVAAAILLFQVLGPVDRTVSGWGEMIAARRAWDRLGLLGRRLETVEVSTVLPRPASELTTEQLFVFAPGTTRAVVQNVTLRLGAGEVLGIMGPTGAGKSAFVNAVAGRWPPVRGVVRFDGAALDQWDPDDLGTHIGHVAQDAELLDGTVARNIARFDPEASTEAVIEAARRAAIHELILRLPQGYETPVGHAGRKLPAGLRQRIAIARALYGNPFVLALDDPTSNLDGEGEQMLVRLLAETRARGGIAIVVTHRPALLQQTDHILHMQDGRVGALGPRDQIMQRLIEATAAARQVKGPDEARAEGKNDTPPPRQSDG